MGAGAVHARPTRPTGGRGRGPCGAQWRAVLSRGWVWGRGVCVCERVQEGACQWALTQKQTLWGGGALEVGDLRLVEDGSQRSGTLGSDVVASETASEGQGGLR